MVHLICALIFLFQIKKLHDLYNWVVRDYIVSLLVHYIFCTKLKNKLTSTIDGYLNVIIDSAPVRSLDEGRRCHNSSVTYGIKG